MWEKTTNIGVDFARTDLGGDIDNYVNQFSDGAENPF